MSRAGAPAGAYHAGRRRQVCQNRRVDVVDRARDSGRAGACSAYGLPSCRQVIPRVTEALTRAAENANLICKTRRQSESATPGSMHDRDHCGMERICFRRSHVVQRPSLPHHRRRGSDRHTPCGLAPEPPTELLQIRVAGRAVNQPVLGPLPGREVVFQPAMDRDSDVGHAPGVCRSSGCSRTAAIQTLEVVARMLPVRLFARWHTSSDLSRVWSKGQQ